MCEPTGWQLDSAPPPPHPVGWQGVSPHKYESDAAALQREQVSRETSATSSELKD